MKIFREIPNKKNLFNNPVITIGSFDGVHAGHQKILSVLLDVARKKSGDPIVLTFDTHPRKILFPQSPPKILTSEREKIREISNFGIENIILLSFSIGIANIHAKEFIDSIINKIGIIEIIAGYDHAFGKNRKGDIDFLNELSNSGIVNVTKVGPENYNSKPVSSTWIRKEIEAGNVDIARCLLRREYTLSGEIVKGEGRGKLLGFPTANLLLDIPDKVIPKDGVYAVYVIIENRIKKPGMLNIGLNPTFSNENKTIEVNIFDFNEDIYGANIELKFYKRIRDEKKFGSIDDLTIQLNKDKQIVQQLINSADVDNEKI